MRRGRERLSRAQARRIALAAQGFAAGRLDRIVTMRDVTGVLGRLGQLQIDSVNVVQRAHYLPLFSRLGPYDTGLLDRAAGTAPRKAFEYWGHAASLIDVRLQPLLRFRMDPDSGSAWGSVERLARERPELIEQVLADVAALGPVTARRLEVVEVRDRSNWGWNWSAVKTALEWLFSVGQVTAARRTSQFERQYDLPSRVLPAAVLARPDPGPEESVRGLVRVAARALGVASEYSLRDYFRTRPAATAQAVAELVDAGELLPVEVEGWKTPGYLWPSAALPRAIGARALISPFDSLIFERRRVLDLFGFHYRIEIYVPAAQRVHGYYVYAFLLGDALVARVDLKADRAAGVLRVLSAWAEPGASTAEVAAELATELATTAQWLDLATVVVSERGDLAAELAAAVSRIPM